MVIFISLCDCTKAGSKFKGVSSDCQSAFKSAWGHPAARTYALKLLKKTDECPSPKKLSIRSQAAFIAANHNFDSGHPCGDQELREVLTSLCKNDFPSAFVSTLWHPHADGTREFGDFVHVELGILVTLSALLLLVSISSVCAKLAVQIRLRRRPELKKP